MKIQCCENGSKVFDYNGKVVGGKNTERKKKKMMRKVCKLARVREKKRKEDELFLAGLIIPTLLFSMASLLSTYNFAHNTMCHPAPFFLSLSISTSNHQCTQTPTPQTNAHAGIFSHFCMICLHGCDA